MQTIKINPEAKKSISWILLITLLATVVLIVLDAKYYNRYADFQTVDAIISDVTRHVTKSPSSRNRTSYTNSITYEYEAAGKTYTATRREFTRIGKTEGEKVSIKYNPDHPEEIQQTYTQSMCMIITALLLFGDWFLWMCVRQMQKEKEEKTSSRCTKKTEKQEMKR